MRGGWIITASVDGVIRFPEHPEHEGSLGLCGGEDVSARRRSFRSVGEAMTWARSVLDGDVAPRWTAYGELLSPHEKPAWSSARVEASNPRAMDAGDAMWTTSIDSREWRELRQGSYNDIVGDVVRVDVDA